MDRIDPRLTAALDTLTAEWGALGVALAAAERTDPRLLAREVTCRTEGHDVEVRHTMTFGSTDSSKVAYHCDRCGRQLAVTEKTPESSRA